MADRADDRHVPSVPIAGQLHSEELTETSCSITLYSTNHTHTHTHNMVNIRPGFSGTGPEIIRKSRDNFVPVSNFSNFIPFS